MRTLKSHLHGMKTWMLKDWAARYLRAIESELSMREKTDAEPHHKRS